MPPKPKFFIAFDGETIASAVRHHTEPFKSVNHACREANYFNAPGREYVVLKMVNPEKFDVYYSGVTKK